MFLRIFGLEGKKEPPMTTTSLFTRMKSTSIRAAFRTTGAAIIISTVSLTSLVSSPQLFAQSAEIGEDVGKVYTVKSGDGLYKLGREFFGKGSDYKKIVRAHNAKAATDSRFTIIDVNKGLSVGQLIWIPAKAADVAPPAQVIRDLRDKNKAANKQIPRVKKPAKPSPDGLATDYSLPKPKKKAPPAQSKATQQSDDPAYVVTPPKTNCEIRIWYNFQIVAIAQLNERWKEEGMSVVERAKKAFEIRHQARLNGRYMMEDKFEVAALRDRDNKKYGNPNGPTFEHMVAFGRQNNLTGDRVYEGIIKSSARVQPVYKSSCVKK